MAAHREKNMRASTLAPIRPVLHGNDSASQVTFSYSGTGCRQPRSIQADQGTTPPQAVASVPGSIEMGERMGTPL